MQTIQITKAEARSAGATTYFTGDPCQRGHISERSVANRICLQCARENQRSYRARNPEEGREKSRAWYAANKGRAAAWKKGWVASHPEQYKERRRKWRGSAASRSREMIAGAKWSAKKKGLAFDIDRAWLLPKIEAGVCELTGLRFVLEPLDGGLQNPYTASLDRIEPAKGYTKGNVRVILWALNAAFNSYGEHVYAAIAKVYLAKRGTGLT